MRVMILALALVAAGCASGPSPPPEPVPSAPFLAQRGTALPPPAQADAGQTAPPEGIASGGLDFSAWRGADPVLYQAQFEARVRARLANLDAAAAQADLERNGFACEAAGERLDCRIEIMERQCAHDWYVVRDPVRPQPVAGYDVMCLGALP